MVRVCIAGVGGVGGTLGGVFGENRETELSLVARGKRKESLIEKGLVLHSDLYGEHCVKAACVAEDGKYLPLQDMIFICVKNYSLRQIAEQIRPCIGQDTVLVPVMNGIEACEVLEELFPGNAVVNGVIYTISSANEDFSITQSGWNSRLAVGTRHTDERHMKAAESVFDYVRSTGFKCTLSEDAMAEMWAKFIQNCGFNIITARYLINAGDFMSDEVYVRDLRALFQEAYDVACAYGISLPENTVEERVIYNTQKQIPTATSSLRRDVEAGRPNELDTFLGALIRKADARGIAVPVSKEYFEKMK